MAVAHREGRPRPYGHLAQRWIGSGFLRVLFADCGAVKDTPERTRRFCIRRDAPMETIETREGFCGPDLNQRTLSGAIRL
jgi:hypothetical protein